MLKQTNTNRISCAIITFSLNTKFRQFNQRFDLSPFNRLHASGKVPHIILGKSKTSENSVRMVESIANVTTLQGINNTFLVSKVIILMSGIAARERISHHKLIQK